MPAAIDSVTESKFHKSYENVIRGKGSKEDLLAVVDVLAADIFDQFLDFKTHPEIMYAVGTALQSKARPLIYERKSQDGK